MIEHKIRMLAALYIVRKSRIESMEKEGKIKGYLDIGL